MSGTPSRRAVLRGATVAVAAALAGCQWGQERTHGSNLFLENTKRGEQDVQLIVSEGEQITGERVVDAWYRVPEGVALEFEGILEAGQTYTIGLQALEESESEHIGVTVEPCEGEATRDVSVRVEEESHGVVPWGCDEEYTERDLEYTDPEEHRVDRPEDAETWRSPTPGPEGDEDGS